MRVKLRAENGAVITCNAPECVADWLARGAVFVEPFDPEVLEVLARVSAQEEVLRKEGDD